MSLIDCHSRTQTEKIVYGNVGNNFVRYFEKNLGNWIIQDAHKGIEKLATIFINE